MIRMNKTLTKMITEGYTFEPLKLQFFVFDTSIVMKVINQDERFRNMGKILWQDDKEEYIMDIFSDDGPYIDEVGFYIRGYDTTQDNCEAFFEFEDRQHKICFLTDLEDFFNDIVEADIPFPVEYELIHMSDLLNSKQYKDYLTTY